MHRRIFQTFAGPGLHRLACGRLRGLDREQQIGPGSVRSKPARFLQYARSSAANSSSPGSCSFRFFKVAIALAPFTNLVLFLTDANKRGYFADDPC